MLGKTTWATWKRIGFYSVRIHVRMFGTQKNVLYFYARLLRREGNKAKMLMM